MNKTFAHLAAASYGHLKTAPSTAFPHALARPSVSRSGHKRTVRRGLVRSDDGGGGTFERSLAVQTDRVVRGRFKYPRTQAETTTPAAAVDMLLFSMVEGNRLH